MSHTWTCRHCGAKMEKQYLNKEPVITRGRKALLIRRRCVNYRPFRDWFLGKHSSYGDSGNMVEWAEGDQITFIAGAYCSCGSFWRARAATSENIGKAAYNWAEEHLTRCAYVPAVTIMQMSEVE